MYMLEMGHLCFSPCCRTLICLLPLALLCGVVFFTKIGTSSGWPIPDSTWDKDDSVLRGSGSQVGRILHYISALFI